MIDKLEELENSRSAILQTESSKRSKQIRFGSKPGGACDGKSLTKKQLEKMNKKNKLTESNMQKQIGESQKEIEL